jgi:tRNA 2-thiouridine synthesizing protein A
MEKKKNGLRMTPRLAATCRQRNTDFHGFACAFGLTTHMGYASLPFAVIDEALGLLKNRHNQNGIGITPCALRSPNNNRLVTTHQRRYDMEFSKEFDASGLACPLPIVKTKKALADMTPGQVLRVISTDPGSVCDMAAFAEQTGNTLLEQGSENSKFVFYLKKA